MASATAAAAPMPTRLRRWWLAHSFPVQRFEVRARDHAGATVLEAFVGDLRVARLVAVPAPRLPAEPWTEKLPKDHCLPTWWVSECFVDHAFRHRGVGRRLVTRLVELTFARHPDALIVGWANSPQGRQFAAAIGFHVQGEAAYASLGGVAERLLV
jgi:GNAT superfamily N-acetyltransferase